MAGRKARPASGVTGVEESKAEMMEELSEGEAQKAAFGEQLGATTGEAGQVVGLVVERVAVREEAHLATERAVGCQEEWSDLVGWTGTAAPAASPAAAASAEREAPMDWAAWAEVARTGGTRRKRRNEPMEEGR